MSDVSKKLTIRFVKPPSSIKPRLLKAMVATYAKGLISKNIDDSLTKLTNASETLVFFISLLSKRELTQLKTALQKKNLNKAKVIFAFTTDDECQSVAYENFRIDGSIILNPHKLEISSLIGTPQLLLRSIITSEPIKLENSHIWNAPTSALLTSTKNTVNKSHYKKFIQDFKQQYLIPRYITDQCCQLDSIFNAYHTTFSLNNISCQLITDSLNFSAIWKLSCTEYSTEEIIEKITEQVRKLNLAEVLINPKTENEFEIIFMASQQLTLTQKSTTKNQPSEIQILTARETSAITQENEAAEKPHSINKAG